MQQKTYNFPKVGGGIVTKTLAPPTNNRTQLFLEVLGKKSFSELLTETGSAEYGIFMLDLAIDGTKLKSLLEISLVEGSDDIEFNDLDMRISDEAIQDFFEQRAEKFMGRRKF